MRYEIALNLNRIGLEKEWQQQKPDTIPTTGLAALSNGKDWYTYFLRKWVDVNVTPEEMYAFGLTEIERVKMKMKSDELTVDQKEAGAIRSYF